MSRIAGSNILITGAASGIGKLMALEMAKQGGNLFLWDIDQAGLERAAAELKEASGREPHTRRVDLTGRDDIGRAARMVKDVWDRVDIIINNAGIVNGKHFLECEDQEVERTFAINTMALFWMAKEFLPDMITANQGHLVTIASAAGTLGVPRLADYCASKWAAVGFDESLRMELRTLAPKVRTTVVCPYYIDTGMFAGVKTRFSFLLPILKPGYAVKKILRAIKRNQRRLMIPRLVYTVPLLRLLPTRLFDFISDLLGVNRSMDDFVGRGGQAESPGQEEAQ